MTTHVENLRERYLALVEAMVVGTIYEDAPLPGFGSGKFVAQDREHGLDWPSKAFTMVGVKRLRNFRIAIESVIRDNVQGDIIETGVWRGGACILARAVLEAYNVKNRRVIVANSFQGLPPPNEEVFPADGGSLFHTYPDLAVSIEQVKANFAKFNLLDEQVVFLQGWFKDTMPTAPVEKLAVIRLDGDMYKSTIGPLDHLWEKLAVGGWVIVDDYEMVPACKAAVEDFLAARGLSPEIYPIDGVGAYFRKGEVAATTDHRIVFNRWPQTAQWIDDSTLRTPNFEFSCSVTEYRDHTNGEAIQLLKDRNFLEIYLDILDGFNPKNVFEIGFFRGGMPLFLAEMVGPDKIVGIDFNPPSQSLIDLIERSGLKDCVKLHGGIFQDDTLSTKELLRVEFGDEPLDMIIDDCSHDYRNTKICFQEYFGYLRHGGKYIIEDWGWLHWPGTLWQTRESPFHGQTPLTNLIFELVMVLGTNSKLVSRVDVVCNSCVIVTRGNGLAQKERLDIDRSYLTSGRHLSLFGGGSPADWS